MIQLYNTLSRKKEVFKPIHKSSVGIYSCGPTVYWYQHIGNLRTYIFSDILKRVFLYNRYKVKHIINVTDVGHLTSDADTGEDKMEIGAKREGKTAKEIANHYLKIFREDFEKLNVLEPNAWPKASEHITEQIKLIKELEKKGFTYRTNDGIYFNTYKLKDYGKLARLNRSGILAGKRIALGEKKHKTDFALWKFSGKPGLRQQEWRSPWGLGFPGWHIECSAMSMKYLGSRFDIHTGGQDHIQIHHTNEIAQSEAATGKPFVNYWLHGAWLLSRGEKVSKSKGGLYTISDLEDLGFQPLAFRYLCLITHYRKPLDFSLENLRAAQNAYQRLRNIISDLRDDKKTNRKYLKEFEEAINDDLDMPKALQVLWNLLRNENANGKLRTIKEMDRVLGLGLMKKEKSIVSEKIKSLIKDREKMRKEGNFREADKIRKKINNLGYVLEDTKEGAVVKKR